MEFYIERFNGVKEIIYKCIVTTPLFMAGADQVEPEIRGSSIKGLLRFWWRAGYVGDLMSMKKKEGSLFGSTEEKTQVEIRVDGEKIQSNPVSKLPRGNRFEISGGRSGFILQYLSYGIENKGSAERKYIKPGYEFTITLRAKATLVLEVDQAMLSLLSIGGMGAKSRNGFGSIHCEACDGFISKQSNKEPSAYVRFSKDTSCYKTKRTFNKWEDALSEIGISYRNAKLSLEPRHVFNKRPLLTRPLISKPENIRITDRLSKPLFLHVAKEGCNEYRGMITVFPIVSDKRDKYEEMMNRFLGTLSADTTLKEVTS